MSPEQWKLGILSVVERIADRDYQAKAWFGLSNSVSSPDELYCGLFDDFIFEKFVESKEVSLTPEQRQKATVLLGAMSKSSTVLDFTKDPAKIIDDPLWQDTRNAAKEFLKSMH